MKDKTGEASFQAFSKMIKHSVPSAVTFLIPKSESSTSKFACKTEYNKYPSLMSLVCPEERGSLALVCTCGRSGVFKSAIKDFDYLLVAQGKNDAKHCAFLSFDEKDCHCLEDFKAKLEGGLCIYDKALHNNPHFWENHLYLFHIVNKLCAINRISSMINNNSHTACEDCPVSISRLIQALKSFALLYADEGAKITTRLEDTNNCCCYVSLRLVKSLLLLTAFFIRNSSGEVEIIASKHGTDTLSLIFNTDIKKDASFNMYFKVMQDLLKKNGIGFDVTITKDRLMMTVCVLYSKSMHHCLSDTDECCTSLLLALYEASFVRAFKLLCGTQY